MTDGILYAYAPALVCFETVEKTLAVFKTINRFQHAPASVFHTNIKLLIGNNAQCPMLKNCFIKVFLACDMRRCYCIKFIVFSAQK